MPAITEAEKSSKTAAQKAVEDYEKKHNLKDGKQTKNDEEPEEFPEPEIELEGMDEKTKAFFKKQSKAIADLTEAVTKMAKTHCSPIRHSGLR